MNFIDVLIVILILGALVRGQELGFVRQLFSTVGFFGGLILGALLEPHVIGIAHTPVTRLIITLTATLGTALILLSIGEFLGVVIKQKLQFKDGINLLDNIFGALLAGASLLVLVWLSVAILVQLPYPELQSSVRGSKVVSLLNKDLPPAPNIIADIGHLIDPNGLPDVFIGAEPSPQTANLPAPADLAAAVNADRESVVKVEGQGCGGIVEGSGFVVDTNLVATNAHVVAGITNPFVTDDRGTHKAVTIWFDPNLDFAVLRVQDLAGPPLVFNTKPVTHGTQGGVLGYPGGGPFKADSAAILDEFTAVGRNIYNEGSTERDVYSINSTVVPGNSGGPLVGTDGRVMGVVFATSTTYNNVGYALSIHQVIDELTQAKANGQEVTTGSCAE